jgi:putative SOS response-associated peptidase YedK
LNGKIFHPLKKNLYYKQKRRFHIFAAVYREASEGNEYSILTKASAQNIKHIHERSPVIVPKVYVKHWFSDYYLDILDNSSVNINYSEV